MWSGGLKMSPSTQRNDETTSALGLLKGHLPPLKRLRGIDVECITVTPRQGLLPLSGVADLTGTAASSTGLRLDPKRTSAAEFPR